MSTKLIPFGKKKMPQPLLESAPKLTSKGPKKSDEGDIIDHGVLGNLNYEIYRRGVIRIFDQGTLLFKKDINLFDNEVSKIDFGQMSEGEEIVIKGSGDNDNLAFSRVNGDICIALKKREFTAVEMLKKALAKGKEKLMGSNSPESDK